MVFPFEVGFDEIQTRIEEFVDTTFNSLKSEFLSMPRRRVSSHSRRLTGPTRHQAMHCYF
jgi:hypothetical protein